MQAYSKEVLSMKIRTIETAAAPETAATPETAAATTAETASRLCFWLALYYVVVFVALVRSKLQTLVAI